MMIMECRYSCEGELVMLGGEGGQRAKMRQLEIEKGGMKG
jgi:hypothetical protein